MTRALIGLAALLSGCHLLAGTQDFVDQPSAGGGAGGGGGGAGCECVPEAPEGWSGPLSRSNGDCAEPYPDELVSGLSDMAAEAAMCSCACGTTGAACSPGSAQIAATDGALCDGACSAALSVGADGCAAAPLSRPPGCVTIATPVLSASNVLAGSWSGSCEVLASEPRLPGVTGSPSSICLGDVERGACEKDLVCAPQIQRSGDQLCIARAGDEPCPVGEYSARTLIHTSQVDDRGCAACSCGDGSCQGFVQLFTNADCSGTALVEKATGDAGCTSLGASLELSASYQVTDLSCQPSAPRATGALTPTEPYTLCCLP